MVKELVKCWVLSVVVGVGKNSNYIVLSDVYDLIVELCYYCQFMGVLLGFLMF